MNNFSSFTDYGLKEYILRCEAALWTAGLSNYQIEHTTE